MRTFIWMMVLSLSVVIGCAAKAYTVEPYTVEPYTVSGRLHYPTNFSLPSDAIATITLTDVSPLQDSSAAFIARQTIHPPHLDASVSFRLEIDPAEISDRHLYAIQARVASAGQVILRNASAYPVITQGHPTTVDVYLSLSSASSSR